MERNFEYLGFRGRTCDIVRIGIDWFDYRDDETELPKVGAFCRKCAKRNSKTNDANLHERKASLCFTL